MKNATTTNIIELAKRLNKEGKRWHFHLVIPECIFNSNKDFGLILENPSENEVIVNYSTTKREQEGKILLELLHGIKADNSNAQVTTETPEAIKRIAKRAIELTDKAIAWHHHALFPDCVFNTAKGKWVVILEDPETKEILESVTDYRPDSDIQLIEPLFYTQKHI